MEPTEMQQPHIKTESDVTVKDTGSGSEFEPRTQEVTITHPGLGTNKGIIENVTPLYYEDSRNKVSLGGAVELRIDFGAGSKFRWQQADSGAHPAKRMIVSVPGGHNDTGKPDDWKGGDLIGRVRIIAHFADDSDTDATFFIAARGEFKVHISIP